MLYRALIFASALIAAPVCAATVHTATGTGVSIDISDNTLPPHLWFVIDTPGAEVYASLLTADEQVFNIFPDPMIGSETFNPEGDNMAGLGEIWGVDLVTASFSAGGEPFTMRWIWSQFDFVSREDFVDSTPIAHAPIPAALPMLLAAHLGLGLLGARHRRA